MSPFQRLMIKESNSGRPQVEIDILTCNRKLCKSLQMYRKTSPLRNIINVTETFLKRYQTN